jgi:hypothetical protein
MKDLNGNEYVLYNNDLPPKTFHNLVEALRHINYLHKKKLLNKFELINQDNIVVWSDYANIDHMTSSGSLDFDLFKNPYEVIND